MKAYTTNIEKRYKRSQLEEAVSDYFRRQMKLHPRSTHKQKMAASISAVARDHKIVRTTLSCYLNNRHQTVCASSVN